MNKNPGKESLVFKTATVILLACFFLSGLTGLLYEVVWVRLFTLIFGHTAYSTAAVLAAFMGGLGAGGRLAGGFIEKRKDAVLFYALAELFIGLYAFVPVLATRLLETLYPAIYSAAGDSIATLTAVKAVSSFIILGPPTFCMGATLPLVSRFFIRYRSKFGGAVSALYGLNTLGAVTGTYLTGFILLRVAGIHDTLVMGMVTNIGIALLAYVQHKKLEEEAEAGEDREEPGETAAAEPTPSTGGQSGAATSPGIVPALLLAGTFIAGLVSLSLEVAWTRSLSMIIGSSIYSFTLVLITFLLGISLGSLAFGRWIRSKPEAVKNNSTALLGILFLALAVSAAVTLPLLRISIYQFTRLMTLSGDNYNNVLYAQFIICLFVMIVPTLLFGAAFPAAATIYAAGTGTVAQGLGRMYMWNTFGAILGSVATGFLLIPLIGVHGSIIAGALLILAGGTVLTAADSGLDFRKKAASVAAAALIAVSVVSLQKWDGRLMSSLPYLYYKALVQENMEIRAGKRYKKLLYYRDGLSSTVTVKEKDPFMSLQVNGKTDASNAPKDIATQMSIAILPVSLHDDPKQAAVIGLGCGMTAGALAMSRGIEHVDVIEIEKNVVTAAGFFRDYNFGVLDNDNVDIHIQDARNYFLIHDRSYDTIISEPSNHWISGVANLYTRDFLELASKRLKPGGIYFQWVQSYKLSPESLRMILATFRSVFPHTYMFHVGYDLILAGSSEPLDLDADEIAGRFRSRGMDELRRSVDSYLSPAGLLKVHLAAGPKEIRKLSLFAPENTDDRPVLEFIAPFEFFTDTEVILSMVRKIYPIDDAVFETENFTAQDYYEIGLDYLNVQFDPVNAVNSLEKCIEKDPRHAEALLGLGELYEEHSSMLRANEYYHRAVESGGGIIARLKMINFLLGQRQLEEVEKEARKAIGMGHGDIMDFHRLLAVSLERQGKHFEASDQYLRAAEMMDDPPKKSQAIFSAYRNLADSGRGSEQFEMQLLAGASALSPHDPDIALELARRLFDAGDIDRARNVAVTALGAHQDNLELRYFLLETQDVLESKK